MVSSKQMLFKRKAELLKQNSTQSENELFQNGFKQAAMQRLKELQHEIEAICYRIEARKAAISKEAS